MNPDHLLLPFALLCLWLPSTVLAPASVRGRLRGPTRRRRDGLRSLVRSKLNWFDALRAAGGTWLVLHGIDLLQPASGAEPEIVYSLLGAKFALLLVGAVVQTLWFDEETRVIGPLFYLAGLACVLAGPMAGVPAVILGVNCALLLGRLRLAFLFTPLALLAFGVLLGAAISGAFGALLFMLPGFLAFALDRQPVYVARPRTATPRRRLLAWPAGAPATAEPAFALAAETTEPVSRAA